MKALGDGEELGRAGDDEPADRYTGARRVGEERAQELDDAAAAVGRVEVPDRAALEELASASDGRLGLRVLLAEQWPEALGRERVNGDLERGGRHGPSISRRPAAGT